MSESEAGMSHWKAVKWLAWTASLGGPGLGAAAKEVLFPSPGNSLGQRLTSLLLGHWKTATLCLLVWILLCLLVWVWADLHERWEKLGRKYPIFTNANKLSPEDLNIRPFYKYFQETEVSRGAGAVLDSRKRLLILG